MPVSPPYRDPDLPADDRVTDLLGRLTTGEKLAMLHQRMPAVPRLGLAAFHTGTEALHGVAWLGTATVFPQAVGLGATWDTDLIAEVGAAVGTEARAFHHRDPSVSLNVWAPVVNPLRDPRWGRNEEGYAEDPHLVADLATAYCRGLRGDHPRVWRTVPTLKHALGYHTENDRARVSATLTPRVLHEYELPAYTGPLAAGVAGAVMPSYNLVNDRPAHLSPLLTTLRSAAAVDIAMVSDAYAPDNLVSQQGACPDHPSARAAALRAGVDSFTEYEGDSARTVGYLAEALKRGLIGPGDVDRAVSRLLALRVRLGEFDGPAYGSADPYAATDASVIGCPAHRDLARRAARAGIVLLRNDGLLPLSRRRRIAVVGPLADVVRDDWYSGTPPYRVPVRDALAEAGAEVTGTDGADRVAWRAPGGGYLSESGTLAAQPCGFDVTDWGGDRCTLRSAATGRYLTVGDDGTPRARAEAPGGWVVNEAFALEPAGPAGERYRIRHAATGRYLVAAAGHVTLGPPPDDPTAHATATGTAPAGTTGIGAGATDADATSDGGAAISGDSAATGDDSAATGDDSGVTGGGVTGGGSAVAATEFVRCPLVDGVAAAARAAREADAVVVVCGNDPHINGRETEDRADLALPAGQEALLRAVVAANPRTALVLVSSYPFAVGAVARDVPAVVWSAHGGQEGGRALADVLLGDHCPAGRLPQTWYADDADLPDPRDGALGTYQYLDRAPLFAFGHGLSYTTFAYGALAVTRDGRATTVTVPVTNTGTRAGDEVVQLYATHPTADRPRRRLLAYRRVGLAPGECRAVQLRVPEERLASWHRGRMMVLPGEYRLHAGGASDDERAVAVLRIDGPAPEPRPMADLAATDFDRGEGVRLSIGPGAGDAVHCRATGWVEYTGCALPPGGYLLRTLVAGDPTPEAGPDAAIEVLVDGRHAATLAITAPGDWTDHEVVVRIPPATSAPAPAAPRRRATPGGAADGMAPLADPTGVSGVAPPAEPGTSGTAPERTATPGGADLSGAGVTVRCELTGPLRLARMSFLPRRLSGPAQ